MEKVFEQNARHVQEEAENIDALCRVCSAPGSHSIFARIPAYCHDHYREYARWKQPIYLLIAEVTGIEITQNDGLPKKICVLCISYLKHAYTFRRQTIDNIAGLLAAKYLASSRPPAAPKKKIPDDDFDDSNAFRSGVRGDEIIQTGDGGSYRSVNLSATAHSRSVVKQTKKAAVMHRFVVKQKPPNNNVEEEVDNLLGELDEPSSGLFGYREKEFVEDDVMDLEGLQEHGITFTLPEDYKEKKCFACRKRFMFSETYAQHLTECLLYKLTESIRSLHHIMFLREQSAISAFEFIRRAVFTIRKCYRLVLSYDGELDEVDTSEPVGTDDTEAIDLKPRTGSSSPEEAVGRFQPNERPYGPVQLDSLSDSGSSESPKAKALPPMYRFAGNSMNNNVPPLMMMAPFLSQPPPFHHLPSSTSSFAATMASHSNVDVIKNRLTKTGAEEVNESNDRYKTVRCKQCDARFYTISHLDEHTKKVHQRPVGKNNPFGLR